LEYFNEYLKNNKNRNYYNSIEHLPNPESFNNYLNNLFSKKKKKKPSFCKLIYTIKQEQS